MDCRAKVFDVWEMITRHLPEEKGKPADDVIKLPVAALFRLHALDPEKLHLTGETRDVSHIQNIFNCKPTGPSLTLKGMTSKLRPYQRLGMEWLRFLYENKFGGLLCDDMGLGKTHQVMAFIQGLWELINSGNRSWSSAPRR